METNYICLARGLMKAFLFDLNMFLDAEYFLECEFISNSNSSVCLQRLVQTFATSIWKTFVLHHM